MKPEDLAALLADKTQAKRPRRTVPIITDGELREQIEAVSAELTTLEVQRTAAAQATTEGRPSSRRINSPDAGRIQSLREDLADLVKQAESKTMYVVVEGLNDTDWAELQSQHKPEPNAEGKIVHVYNPKTIKKPLVKRCIIGHRESNDANAEIHKLDDETVDWLLEFVNARQLDQLADAAYNCTERDGAVPLDRIRALLSANGSAAA